MTQRDTFAKWLADVLECSLRLFNEFFPLSKQTGSRGDSTRPLIPISNPSQAGSPAQRAEKAELFLNVLSLTSVTICDFLTIKRIVQLLKLH